MGQLLSSSEPQWKKAGSTVAFSVRWRRFSRWMKQYPCFRAAFSPDCLELLEPGLSVETVQEAFSGTTKLFSSAFLCVCSFFIHVADSPGTAHRGNTGHLGPRRLVCQLCVVATLTTVMWLAPRCIIPNITLQSWKLYGKKRFMKFIAPAATELQANLCSRRFIFKAAASQHLWRLYLYYYMWIFLFKMYSVSKMDFHTQHISRTANLLF